MAHHARPTRARRLRARAAEYTAIPCVLAIGVVLGALGMAAVATWPHP
ncbi:hypothetical protein JJV70_07035 [Streptomyces sp. JJ66]|nr:hypothetical protein [Streptomyces sp. JJ66]MBW1601867.1 hypothetical protein [Streptomyces sp. JJ66]